MNLLDRMAYDTGGYTVQEILSSFCKKILEIIDLVNKNEEVCDEVHAIIENIRNEVVPELVDDIMKELQDDGYFDSLVNVTLIENLRTELTTLLNEAITDFTTRLDNNDTLIADKFLEIQNYLETQLNTLRNKTNIIMSVKEFGAKGDGVSDDTEAINDCILHCITHGKTVYFPNGKYKVNSNLYQGYRNFPNVNISILGESPNLVWIDNINGFSEDFKIMFDLVENNKITIKNICSETLGVKLISDSAYKAGEQSWRLALRDKDIFIENVLAKGKPCLLGYNFYINTPCPPNYNRYNHANYQRYPLQITNGSGYNAIDINNFMTNQDGSIGSPQDNSAIGIVDACNNSTGVFFVDMIGQRSFQRFVKRGALVSSAERPDTVFEVHHNGHLAIGCSSVDTDSVAKGWETVKLRDNSPKIAFFDANNNNEKFTVGLVNQSWGEQFEMKFGDVGLGMTLSDDKNSVTFSGFNTGGIDNGVLINHVNTDIRNTALTLNNGTNTLSLISDKFHNLRLAWDNMTVSNSIALQPVLSCSTADRPNMSGQYNIKGFSVFDITLGRPIWWNGSKWVDSTGAGV